MRPARAAHDEENCLEARPVTVYAASVRYEVGHRLARPKLGRALVHARGGVEKLEKPRPVGHSKPVRSKV